MLRLQLAGAEAVPETAAGHGHLHQAERAAVAVRQDRLGAEAGDDLLPAAADLGEGFVPGDALPLAAALGADAAQRIQHAVGVVDVIEVGADLGAEPAGGDGVVGVAAEADGAAVLRLR